MLKIRRSRDRLIFNMRIPIPGKDHLFIEIGPRLAYGPIEIATYISTYRTYVVTEQMAFAETDWLFCVFVMYVNCDIAQCYSDREHSALARLVGRGSLSPREPTGRQAERTPLQPTWPLTSWRPRDIWHHGVHVTSDIMASTSSLTSWRSRDLWHHGIHIRRPRPKINFLRRSRLAGKFYYGVDCFFLKLGAGLVEFLHSTGHNS